MSSNDVVFLNSILQEKVKDYDGYDESEFFELFSFEQILKDFDLTYEELAFGNVDGGEDGGVDGFFLFVDKEYAGEGFTELISINQNDIDDDSSTISSVDDDFQIDSKKFKKNLLLELFIVQAKQSPSFAERVFDRAIPTLKDILDYNKSYEELNKYYDSFLLEKVFLFRKIFLQLAPLHPFLTVNFVYASKGDTSSINQNVINRGNILKGDIASYFSSAKVNVDYLGARELLNQSRIERNYTLSLDFVTNYLSGGKNSYILLSKMADYYNFLTEDSGSIRKYIFESNVRDYQGNVEVNKDIRATLEEPDDNLDFWWLNNGITILASEASIVGNTINLDDVQIINGLQTTYSIYNYFKDKPDLLQTENRSISVKIIVIDQNHAFTRDKIIKATNFQTAIQPYSLRATDQIQRDIEDYFLTKGWFYDRRKNFHKNNGKPANKIVSIQYLSQVFMAIVLRKPQNARSNPVSLIKDDPAYKNIFSSTISPDVYLFCAKYMKVVESYLRRTSSQDWKIAKYHIAMFSLIKHFENLNYSLDDLVGLLDFEADSFVSDETLSATLDSIKQLGSRYIEENGSDFTKITKTKDFTTYVQNNILIE